MTTIEMWDRGAKVRSIAISAGVRERDVVADIESHGRHIRSPLPRNSYEQVNRMRRKANEVRGA